MTLHPDWKHTVLIEILSARLKLDAAERALEADDVMETYNRLVEVEGHVDKAQRVTDDMSPDA
jgi:hypothetical protein